MSVIRFLALFGLKNLKSKLSKKIDLRFHPSVMILAMIVWTLILLYAGYSLSVNNIPLLPAHDSPLKWRADTEPKVSREGVWLKVNQHGKEISYGFHLSASHKFPYTAYNFTFVDEQGQRTLVDISRYDSLSFEASCSPRNILILNLFTFDDKATDIKDTKSYRVNSHFFTCNLVPEKHTIKLRGLTTPDWWLQKAGLELVDRNYDLQKVISFGFVNSLQSPRGIDSSVRLSKVAFKGMNWGFIYVALGLSALMWVFFGVWVLRRFIAMAVESAKSKMREDLPLIAYQKLSIEPHKDKSKSELLRYLAENYASPDLSLDLVVADLGMNRNKINEILKGELGLTFTSYVNKLRLTEASRLLSNHPEEAVAQIAYKVGFNNVTYFNKLFKNAYGCSPKRFKEGISKVEGKP